MSDSQLPRLSDDELAAEGGTLLPNKEVLSLLDLNVDLDLGLDLAAPIDAAVAANIGSIDSSATAIAEQDALIVQNLDGVAEATADQDATITQ